MPPKDKSIINSKQNKDVSYLEDLAFAVCVNGESLEKYKKIVEKKYGTDTYTCMEQFAMALQQQVNRRQFTQTSLLNLKYIGKNAGLSEDAIDMIIHHFDGKIKGKIKEEQLKREEDEYWNNCSRKDKSALKEYLRKYPKGQYAKEAHDLITAINKEEIAQREDSAFWEKCNPNDKRQLKEYLRKYPTGLYAARAASLISDLERIEKMAIEESRMFNQCRTKREYIGYLRKYPNGAYVTKAKSKIAEIERIELEEIEENRMFNLCRTREDFMDYLRKYPTGQYVKKANEKIIDLDAASRLERDIYVSEQESYQQCKTKDDFQRYLSLYPNGIYANQARNKIAHLENISNGLGDNNNKKNDFDSKVTLGNNKKKLSLKGLLGLLISTIILYAVAFFIRDEYKNLGPFLCLVSFFPYMLFAFEVVRKKKIGLAICIAGWFVMMFIWSDSYAAQPIQAIISALVILGICSFLAVIAYLSKY